MLFLTICAFSNYLDFSVHGQEQSKQIWTRFANAGLSRGSFQGQFRRDNTRLIKERVLFTDSSVISVHAFAILL